MLQTNSGAQQDFSEIATFAGQEHSIGEKKSQNMNVFKLILMFIGLMNGHKTMFGCTWLL